MTDLLEVDATQNGWDYPRWAEIDHNDATEETSPAVMTDHAEEEQRELEASSFAVCSDRGHFDGKSLFI